jgi:hypothetical protein
MTILIDADGCPVVDLTLRSAGKKGVPVVILCDTSHRIEREGAQTLVFDKGADSVDFALVNRVKPGDLVVTQDYGLASMCLAKCARLCPFPLDTMGCIAQNHNRHTFFPCAPQGQIDHRAAVCIDQNCHVLILLPSSYCALV